ncbi:unnamed protein product [Clonostachys byssicola]|uniref:Uncharacterized protein n=1 Tax=Clonostachys byssicola TaxID=160290 RepID=A0A9N9US09_9HYPO|nr:unnamed protein product [Clonostachys byssicola]
MSRIYRADDVGPFVALKHTIVYGDSGPQKVDLDIHDTDVVFDYFLGSQTLKILHLQNVRAATLTMAQSAVEDFLDELRAIDKSNDKSPRRRGDIYVENFDTAHGDLANYIRAQTKEHGPRFKWYGGTFPRESLRRSLNKPNLVLGFDNEGRFDRIYGSHTVTPRGDPDTSDGGTNSSDSEA